MLSTQFALPTAVLDNDTIIGDPLFRAAMLLNGQSTNLCYEIHGASNRHFSLVSDSCVAVNALYTAMNNPSEGNIISEIGVVAVNSGRDNCFNYRIRQNNGVCVTSRVAGIETELGSTFDVSEGGINIRQMMQSRVRISVPNCERVPLVMWVTCELFGNQSMIRFDISRGLNLRATSHGLLGMHTSLYCQPLL